MADIRWCVVLAVGFAACKSAPAVLMPPQKCETQKVEVVLTTSDRLNLDDEGRSLPTVFRLYQLKGTAKLENAEFEDLWRRDKEVLGEELLSVEELTLYPSKQVTREVTRDPKATHLVGMAVFRRPAGTSWRNQYLLPKAPLESECKDLRGSFYVEQSRIDVWDRLYDRPPEPKEPTVDDVKKLKDKVPEVPKAPAPPTSLRLVPRGLS